MLGRTLTLYFAWNFAKLIVAIFLVSLGLIAVSSYLELASRALGSANVNWPLLTQVALFRVPGVSEDTIPFIVLYGAITAFVITNRRLEIVVARAAGVSAWQFLVPACAVGLLLGVLATVAYNPLSSSLFALSQKYTAQAFGDGPRQIAPNDATGPVWIRQKYDGVESIIGAQGTFDGGLGLTDATAYVFTRDGRFSQRIDAPRAHYQPGAWQLENAVVTTPDAPRKDEAAYALPTDLSANEVKQAFLQLNAVSFWTLPSLIVAAQRAGVPTSRYKLQYNALLARPILLMAMVLIAANVSLRYSRSRNLAAVIITGVAIGFMLYMVLKIAGDLGSGGVVPPLLAAWLPAIVATLVGVTVLLHLEDG